MLKTFRRFRDALRPEISQADLATILREMNPNHLIDVRMTALEKLMGWLRQPVRRSLDADEITHIQSRNIRFKFLLQFLDHNTNERTYFVEGLRELLGQGIAVRLYCMTGVSENYGFFTELLDRVVSKALPHVYSERDLAELFKAIFTEEEDAEWFEASHSVIIPPVLELIRKNDIALDGIKSEIADALIILGAQISSLGVSKGIRRRLRTQTLTESSFVRLNKLINAQPQNPEEILSEVVECRLNLKRVRERAESTGVSVDLVYNLERLSALLNRVETLVYLQTNEVNEQHSERVGLFIGKIIRDELHLQSLKEFLDDNVRMLTRKIVERAGEKGDSYIAYNAQERHHLFWAATGAGILTAFTALIKTLISYVDFPLLFEGWFIFVNYALSFLLMQRWHLALSSKTPAYTASALSRRFETFLQTKNIDDVTGEVRAISHSQFIAAVANLLWVVPFVMLLDWSYFYFMDEHLVSPAVAQTIVDKHNLLTSGTFIFAAFTGVLLWLSSVVSGWVENWVVFRNVPQMLKESPFLDSFLGREKARKFADSFAPLMGGIAGNVSIAFFLTAPAIFGKFTGIPLDIRHVTLATGTITLALQALPWDVSLIPILVSMGISILTMGLLNFGVSFYCSIRMAALARGVPARYVRVIFKHAFSRKPGEILK